MMSLRLNLLSPDKKRNVISVARFLFIKEMLEMLIFTVALLAIMYLFAWWVVTQAMRDAVTSSLLVTKNSPPINDEIRTLNNSTKAIVAAGSEFLPLTPKLMELITNLPKDVKITAVNLNRTNNTIVIGGVAATRDALLNYQNEIGKVTWISGVTIPKSQLFQKSDITFEIHGKINGLPLLKK